MSEVAKLFHDTYERLAPDFGYETRKDTKEFDPESPNGKLMIAVCGKVFKSYQDQLVREIGEVIGHSFNTDQIWISKKGVIALIKEGKDE